MVGKPTLGLSVPTRLRSARAHHTKFTARRSKNKILDGWHPFSGDTRGILPCVYLMDPNHWITETLSARSPRFSRPVCVSAAGAVQQIGPFSVGKIIDSLALGALLLISRGRAHQMFFPYPCGVDGKDDCCRTLVGFFWWYIKLLAPFFGN